MASKCDANRYNPANYTEEFEKNVDEHGFLKAVQLLWSEHTDLNLKRVGAVIASLYLLRYTFNSTVGLGGMESLLLSLGTVFILAQAYHRYANNTNR